MVIQGLDEPSLNDEDTQKDRRATIVSYFTGHLNTHTSYIARFVFCEFLNLVNIVGQVSLVIAYHFQYQNGNHCHSRTMIRKVIQLSF